MRVACEQLNRDFGIKMQGNVRDVNFTVSMGDISVTVDWNNTVGNGDVLSTKQIRDSRVLELAAAVANAAGVWYNVTHDKECYDIASDLGRNANAAVSVEAQDFVAKLNPTEQDQCTETPHKQTEQPVSAQGCPTCPPCNDCPPCPVSYCDFEDTAPCSYTESLSKTFSWEGICCNDALSQIDTKGVGRDIFWPPQPPFRNYTVESIVGPRHLSPFGCAASYAAEGLRGAPMVRDAWSGWMTAYYGGRNVSHHRNIVWSNGALDPWSGQGVYPEGGGPDGPMVQNVSEDGSQIALILDLGAHHLDLMFSHPENPPCFKAARAIEERMIKQWCQEAYDKL